MGTFCIFYKKQCDQWARYTDFYSVYRVQAKLEGGGVYGYHCNPGPILPHLCVKIIVLDQKLTKLQHFKVNSSKFHKKSFRNSTFTTIEHFSNLSVIKLCLFLKEWACTRQKQGGIEGAICKKQLVLGGYLFIC